MSFKADLPEYQGNLIESLESAVELAFRRASEKNLDHPPDLRTTLLDAYVLLRGYQHGHAIPDELAGAVADRLEHVIEALRKWGVC